MAAKILNSNIGRLILTGIGLLIIYGVINLFLVGGQKIWHHADQKKLDETKIGLDLSLKEIKAIELVIREKETELNKMKNVQNSFKTEIDRLESKYPSGIPEFEYSKYKKNIDTFNEMINQYNLKLGAYNQVFDDYDKKFNDYNIRVDEANKLAEKIGSTWYVVPIPGRGK